MQSSRSRKRNNIQDLDLRLGPSCPPIADILARNCNGGCPNLIMIEDDDDDEVLVYSPSPRTSARAMPLFPISSSWVPVVSEEELELTLGPSAHKAGTGRAAEGKGEPSQTWKCVKKKYGFASTSRHCTNKEVESIQLRCTICMDTMKEETSTTCGHVFCKSCIVHAILVQNRCPTCRKELSMSNIHRIYLPGATS